MSDIGQCVVFCVEGDNSTSMPVGVSDLKGCLYPVCSPVDLEVGGQPFKECADIVVGIVFFKCQFWVIPDLSFHGFN